ncbi:MAG: hypothetical protein ABW217_18010 [Polyangiaceae bacterium]
MVGGGFALPQVNGFGNAWHVPVALEQDVRKPHDAWFWKVPLAAHSCGMLVVGLQRRSLGTHSPVQAPPEHTNGQGVWSCQRPPALQS